MVVESVGKDAGREDIIVDEGERVEAQERGRTSRHEVSTRL